MPSTPLNSPMIRVDNDLSVGAFGGAPRSPTSQGLSKPLQNAVSVPKEVGASAFLKSAASTVARGGPARGQSEASALMRGIRASADVPRVAVPESVGGRLVRGTSESSSALLRMLSKKGGLGASGRTVQFAVDVPQGADSPASNEDKKGRAGAESSETFESIWKKLNHSLPPRGSGSEMNSERSKSIPRVRSSFVEPEDEVGLMEGPANEGFQFGNHDRVIS